MSNETDIKLYRADKTEKSIIRKMIELYLYDFSEYNLADINEHGEYGYDRLDDYWTDNSRYPYIINYKGKKCGFAFVREIFEKDEMINNIAEYFIMRKYRKKGIGRYIAFKIFSMNKGKWQINVLDCNKPAIIFWENIIKEHSKNDYRIIKNIDWDGPVFEFKV